jgi:hypothetical protein
MKNIKQITLALLLISFGFTGFAGNPGHFYLTSKGNCSLSRNVVMTFKGNLINSGAFESSGSSQVIFLGTTTENIGGTGSTQFQNADVNNTANCQLTGHISVNGILKLVTGNLNLGNYDLTIGNSGSITGTFGTNAMIVADATAGNTGQLKKVYTAGANNFTFPIGDINSTADYSPVMMNLTANSTDRTIGVNVADEQAPNDWSTNNYLSRYWSFTDNAGTGTYTYDAKFTYSANSPSDLVGTYNALGIYWWNGKWNKINTTYPGATDYSVSNVTQTSGTLGGSQFTGRSVNQSVNNINNDESAISVFPNPVKNELNILISNSHIIQNLEIVNSLGQIIFKTNITDKKIVDLADLAGGIYMLRLYSAESTSNKMFVKMK